MKSFLARIACGAVVAAGVMVGNQGQAWAQAQGDAAKGQKVFIKCQTCHRIGDGAKNLIGPILTGVVGRKAGTVEGFAYSPLNRASGENGLVWTEEQILAYLPDPNAFLKKFLAEKGKPELAAGTTKMVFKLASDEERRDVIAYLKTFAAK
ncbi:MAG: c-type cytochrome [Rubrivivax sp.]|nr:c-type cytochrome [Rubrivivax sp.]